MTKMRHCRSTLESIRFVNGIPIGKPISDTEFQEYCLDGVITSKDAAAEEMYRLTVERTAWQKREGECPKHTYFKNWMAKYEEALNKNLDELLWHLVTELDWALMGMRQARRVSCECHQNFCFAVNGNSEEIGAVIKKVSPTGLAKYVYNNHGHCAAYFNGDSPIYASTLVIDIDLHINTSARRRLINAMSMCLGLGFQVTHENGETFLRQQSTLHDPNPTISNFADFNGRKITIPR